MGIRYKNRNPPDLPRDFAVAKDSSNYVEAKMVVSRDSVPRLIDRRRAEPSNVERASQGADDSGGQKDWKQFHY